ncbi:hypothetical protein SDC9_190571 [bioreactor metagenome]|uniref:Uncharacterized protein n=1 Tax=bioreactor metagenome TaxID=1076179 RepID=A0A645HX08_9ZZZZ
MERVALFRSAGGAVRCGAPGCHCRGGRPGLAKLRDGSPDELAGPLPRTGGRPPAQAARPVAGCRSQARPAFRGGRLRGAGGSGDRGHQGQDGGGPHRPAGRWAAGHHRLQDRRQHRHQELGGATHHRAAVADLRRAGQ